MLKFKVRRSANIFDRSMGPGQIWVSPASDIQFLSDDSPDLNGEFPHRRVGWRIGWDDQWQWIETYWAPDEDALFIDDVMKREEDQSVMFFVPEGNRSAP